MRSYFYFGVLHPVVRILSRLLEEQSFATIFQGVYFILFLYFAAQLTGGSIVVDVAS
jgi:hypothetical protein